MDTLSLRNPRSSATNRDDDEEEASDKGPVTTKASRMVITHGTRRRFARPVPFEF